MSTNTQLIRSVNARSDNEGWQILYYYNIYRLVLTVLLVMLASPTLRTQAGLTSLLTLWVPIFGIAIISAITFFNIRRQKPALYIQAHALFILDIVFISTLTFAHHLLDSSTLILYITTAAATAVLFHLRISLAYTCIAAVLILLNDYLNFRAGEAVIGAYYLTPILIVGLFSAVIFVGVLANRSRTAQTVVKEQGRALADLDQINQVVLEQLDVGVLFLDKRMKIAIQNKSARDMIGHFIDSKNSLTGELAEVLSVYLKIPKSKGFTFRVKNKELGVSTLPLRNGYLVQIADQTSVQKQIQQSKLASIGRMASAISHEIRNPLSAINHAAQLLVPIDPQNEEDAELINIIRTHAKRIDNIIESVLQRSRPGKAERKEIQLLSWLQVFMDTFRETITPGEVTLSLKGEDTLVMFDPTQLEQILTNLCQNAIKYARPISGNLEINLTIGNSWDGIPYMDVSDNGQGIDDNDVDQLFEPFHTTDSQSNGLGLFLVREFCNFNGAEIEYVRATTQQGFRITFQEPEINTPAQPEADTETYNSPVAQSA